MNTLPRSHWNATRFSLEFISLFALFFSAWLTVLRWKRLPATIAIHFGFWGEPNSWGAKGWAAALPIITASMYLLLTFLRSIPNSLNIPFNGTPGGQRRQRALAVSLLDGIKCELVLMFSVLQWQSLNVVLGKQSALLWWILPASLSVIVATIILFIVIMYRNR